MNKNTAIGLGIVGVVGAAGIYLATRPPSSGTTTAHSATGGTSPQVFYPTSGATIATTPATSTSSAQDTQLQAEIAQLTSQLSGLQTQKSSLQSTLNGLVSNQNQLQAQVTSLKSTLSQLQAAGF